MPESRCDVIVLAWNKLWVTKAFVESFFAHTAVDCRLIIINNGSTDGTAEYLAALKGSDKISVKVVNNPENLGFVKGMNQGIALADAPYVCLANNDLLFTDGWLEEIIRLFESNPAIGVLNPNSNNLGARPPKNGFHWSTAKNTIPRHSEHIRFAQCKLRPQGEGEACLPAGRNLDDNKILRLRHFASQSGEISQNDEGGRVLQQPSFYEFAKHLGEKYRGVFEEMPFCIGFCMFVRGAVIEKVGGLSEEFIPMFFEDTDYSLKASKAGYLIGVAKGAYVWHKEHASFKLGEKKWEGIFSRNKEIFREKWGKTLRITWIIDNDSELDPVLNDAVILSRTGNFVWVAVKNLNESRAAELRSRNFSGLAPVKFIGFHSGCEIFCRLIVKKKRPDLVINKGRFLNAVLSIFGYKVADRYNAESIAKIKYAKTL